ncbi:MAG: thiopurine S-methyltransferase [bacterium]|nr:thiopurine S-methyltransferase [bacterium]
MHHDFWHERWRQNQIGFHQPVVNLYLQRFWPKLHLKEKARVLVPLCGKSSDMLWLLEQGFQVVGVELSTLAVDAFFAENNLQAAVRRKGDFVFYELDDLQIYCGDFFAIGTEMLGRIDAVYDRASLIALPPEMRVDYARQMSNLLMPGTESLLITFDYLQEEMSGPPFSVSAEEIEQLYGDWCDIDILACDNVEEPQGRFKDQKLSQITERVFRLAKRPLTSTQD